MSTQGRHIQKKQMKRQTSRKPVPPSSHAYASARGPFKSAGFLGLSLRRAERLLQTLSEGEPARSHSPPWGPLLPARPLGVCDDHSFPFATLLPVGGEAVQNEPPPEGAAWACGLF